jgi:hypothetical protein
MAQDRCSHLRWRAYHPVDPCADEAGRPTTAVLSRRPQVRTKGEEDDKHRGREDDDADSL